jgi:hypothetical protein
MGSKVESLKADYAKKLAQAEQEDAITARVPPGGRVFVHSLYGEVASVKYGDIYRHEDACTWDEAKRLVRALPPVALTMVRDGCLSFRPAEHVDSLSESSKERWQEESAVSPVLMHIEGFQGPTLTLSWVSRVPDVGLVRVDCVMGNMLQHRGLGTYSAKRVEYQGGFRYERAKFTPADGLHTIHDIEDNGPAVQLESPIVWASGGPEYPSRITCYFVDLGQWGSHGLVGRIIVDGLAALAGAKMVQS